MDVKEPKVLDSREAELQKKKKKPRALRDPSAVNLLVIRSPRL